jgi:hypothetical protein
MGTFPFVYLKHSIDVPRFTKICIKKFRSVNIHNGMPGLSRRLAEPKFLQNRNE